MRESEEISAKILSAFLKKAGYKVYFEDGDDPPDINFYVARKKWAVEHTQLHQYTDFNGNEISRIGIDSKLFSFEKYINQKFKNELEYQWILAINGPITKNQILKIEQEVVNILQKEKNKKPFKHSNKLYSIEKQINKNPKIVIFSMLSPSSRIPESENLTCDIQGQINYAVDRILRLKRPKFQRMVSYDKRVLLIENQYMFSTQENVTTGFSAYPGSLKEIDSVYLINYEDVHLIY
jgi:hypothetical protein